MPQRKKSHTEHDYDRDDPTNRSVLPQSVTNFKEVGKNDYKRPILEDEYGRKLHQIRSYTGENQMLLARLLKGIIPVSDVIYDESRDTYYSYELPLDAVAQNEFSTETGKFILEWVFGDADHGVHPGGENVRFSTDQPTHVFFDFEQFDRFWRKSDFHYDFFGDLRKAVRALPVRELEELSRCADILVDRFESEKGREFIAAIVADMEKMGQMSTVVKQAQSKSQNPIAYFQAEILKRITEIRKNVSKSTSVKKAA